MASSSKQIPNTEGVQKYKIYTDSSSGLSNGNSSLLGDCPDSPSWMYIDAGAEVLSIFSHSKISNSFQLFCCFQKFCC